MIRIANSRLTADDFRVTRHQIVFPDRKTVCYVLWLFFVQNASYSSVNKVVSRIPDGISLSASDPILITFSSESGSGTKGLNFRKSDLQVAKRIMFINHFTSKFSALPRVTISITEINLSKTIGVTQDISSIPRNDFQNLGPRRWIIDGPNYLWPVFQWFKAIGGGVLGLAARYIFGTVNCSVSMQ